MSAETISALRQRMIEDMKARQLGARTQRSHIHSCKRLLHFCGGPTRPRRRKFAGYSCTCPRPA